MIKLISVLALLGAYDVPRPEINCIATAVYHEARGEPIKGQAAVANVILNRVESSRFPDTACEVVYQPHQFTDVGKASPDKDSRAWELAVAVAALTYMGEIVDYTKGATHYYAHKKVTPWWSPEKQTTTVIGGHTFKVAKR